MATQCNNLIDIKTEDKNHQREETKPGILYDSTIVQNVPKEQFGCKVCPKSFQLVTDLLKHFKVHLHPKTTKQKEQQTLKDWTPNLKCENENITIGHNVPKLVENENENEHFDVEGNVIKTELKVERGMTQNQKQ